VPRIAVREPLMMASRVEREDGQPPDRAPPDPRPGGSGRRRARQPELGQHRLGDGVPQPAKDLEHFSLGRPQLSLVCLRVEEACSQELFNSLLGVLAAYRGKRDVSHGLRGVAPKDEGVTSVIVGGQVDNRALDGLSGQRVRPWRAHEVSEPGIGANLGEQRVEFVVGPTSLGNHVGGHCPPWSAGRIGLAWCPGQPPVEVLNTCEERFESTS